MTERKLLLEMNDQELINYGVQMVRGRKRWLWQAGHLPYEHGWQTLDEFRGRALYEIAWARYYHGKLNPEFSIFWKLEDYLKSKITKNKKIRSPIYTASLTHPICHIPRFMAENVPLNTKHLSMALYANGCQNQWEKMIAAQIKLHGDEERVNKALELVKTNKVNIRFLQEKYLPEEFRWRIEFA